MTFLFLTGFKSFTDDLDIENSEFKYSDNAQYFGDVAQELINEGVRLIGGNM
jgi:methionine synthase I (cobalamin-dependent)